MAKKKESKKNSDEKDKDSNGGKQKIEFNLSDGVTWHDFVGFFILIGQFLYKIVRLVLAPLFWVWSENVRMWRFIRAKGHDRPMNKDERYFVETLPVVFTMTGLVGGVLVGIFGILSLQESIQEFIDSISLEAFATLFNFIGAIIGWILRAILWIFTGIFNVVEFIYKFIVGAFQVDPFIVFFGMVGLGFVILLIWLAISELGVIQSFMDWLNRMFIWIIGSPDRFRLRLNTWYRRFNHKFTSMLIGDKTITTRTQSYFKKIVMSTFVFTLWSFFSGIFIGLNSDAYGSLRTDFAKVAYIAAVLFIAGIVSGTIFFAFVARFLDLFSRKKYIASQFINKEGGLDADAIDKAVKEDEKKFQDEMEEQEEKARQMALKEIKKREEEKKLAEEQAEEES